MEGLGLVIIVAVLVVLLGLLSSMIRIVPQFQRLVVFRLGRCIGARGPGVVLLYPFGIDRAISVDLREEVREVPHQTNITKDNAPIGIDFLIYWQVVDSVKSVLEVNNFRQAALGIATTTLRAVIGDIALDDVLAQREHINQVLRAKLDEVTERWGVKVTAVEIREIVPPREVQDAMTRQMSAERSRRAVVTEALGNREAAVTVAEGQKQAAILAAEGKKQAAILEAEGQRAAQALFAEGFAVALDRIYEVAKTVDAKTMALQYLDALKSIGASPSTKFIFPMEFTSLMRPLIGMTEDSMSK
ncbi:MAG TPA: SPFH domain-containing protein [Anaerolineae bacterium]|nr:SPFH domain-containing protein [Anaerolineae bacterium]